MKKYFRLIIIFAFLVQTSLGQTLDGIFIQLADFGGITKSDRKLMIDNFKTGKNGVDNGVGQGKNYLVRYDPKNGFLSYSGAYKGGTSLTFWNISDGTKLIARSSSYCGPICDQDLDFFIKTKSRIIKLKRNNVLPTITLSDFMDTDAMIRDSIDLVTAKELFYKYDLLYRLPSKGKSIIVESQFNEISLPTTWKKYDLGWKIELIWNDGIFVKKNSL